MADIHINYNNYNDNEKDKTIEFAIEKFREIARVNLKSLDGKFLFEYVDKYNQFDLLEYPENLGKAIFPYLVNISNEFPNCFIAGIEYYKNI